METDEKTAVDRSKDQAKPPDPASDTAGNPGAGTSDNAVEKTSVNNTAPERKDEATEPQASSLRKQISAARDKVDSSTKAVRSALAPMGAKASKASGKTAHRVGVRARRLTRRKVYPRFAAALSWLGARLHPRSVLLDYRRLLLLIHSAFVGRSREALFFAATRGHVALTRFNIPSQVRQTAHDYRPTPFAVFDWAMQLLPEDVSDFVFVDYGAGRGRALLLASHHPFEHIVGAEIAQELHEDCEMNIAQYPRSLMKCRNVECRRTRATTLPIPDAPCVFYFFDPFDASVLEKVLARITRSYKRDRRAIFLVFVDTDERATVDAQGIFAPVEAPFALKAKIKLFSPYPIRAYQTQG